MRPQRCLVLGLVGGHVAAADPTWPSDSDDLEEIMFQLFDFKARKFADAVYPCDSDRSGPGRQSAAEFLRTAFHDMAPANRFRGTGGLDASLQYELSSGENMGPAFASTLGFMSSYFSQKTSMADLIALGVYTSVRSCDGPAVPIRYGRKDATSMGEHGVPQVDNSTASFRQQFFRMGFNPSEMIQLVACGHTLGGVHSQEFPQLNPPGRFPNDEGPLDSSNTKFDNQGVLDYLDGSTDNPLVRGPSVDLGHDSDFRIFSSDGNRTIKAMTNNDVFKAVCKRVLQRMIDVVPGGVTLSAPIEPYMVKPVDMQLTLSNDAKSLLWTGYIRVRTTNMPLGEISSVSVTLKDRNGASKCSPEGCTTTASMAGTGSGFDDSFAFFSIDLSIPVEIGISSFTVTVIKSSGEKVNFNNNGKEYPVQDAVILQAPQSCFSQSGSATIVAAVRNDIADQPAKALISYKSTRADLPVPGLQEAALEMRKVECVGSYTLFKAETSIPGGLGGQSRVDVMSGGYTDGFKMVSAMGDSCEQIKGSEKCDDVTAPPSSSTTSTSSTSSMSSTATPKWGTNSTSTPLWSKSSSSSSTSSLSWSGSATTTSASWSTTSSTSSSWGSPSGKPSSSHKPTTSWKPTWSKKPTSSWKPTGSSSAKPSKTSKPWTTSKKLTSWKPPAPTSTPKKHWTTSSSSSTSSSTSSSSTSQKHWPTTSTSKTTSTPWSKPTFSMSPPLWKSSSTSSSWSSSSSTPSSPKKPTSSPTWNPPTKALPNPTFKPLPPSSSPSTSPKWSPPPTAKPNPSFKPVPSQTPQTPTQPARIGPYTYQGCHASPPGTHPLPLKTLLDPSAVSNALCANACRGHAFFGTEDGNRCWCGDWLDKRAYKVGDAECGVRCDGAGSEVCGGRGRVSVYGLGK